jgi:ParB-like chromosome segregation protein Spo0J
MHVELKRVCELQPAPYNPRKPLKPGSAGYERLARSLREFSLVQPLVWNSTTGHVVGGHQRLAVLKDAGIEEVPCVVVALPLEREKALNVALNNSRVGGEWDVERLGELIQELADIPDFDETLTGFDEKELRDLVLEPVGNLAPEDSEDDGMTRVTLEVPTDKWEEVRPWLDEVVGEFGLRVHMGKG